MRVGPYAGRNLFREKPASVSLITVGVGGGTLFSLSVLTRPPTIPLLPRVCSSRKLLLSALTELRGRCNLHISAPRGCNAWGQEPAHVLWSVCRIQVLRREREICWEDDAGWGCLPLGTRLLSHKNRWCLRGPSRPGILAILPWGASRGMSAPLNCWY